MNIHFKQSQDTIEVYFGGKLFTRYNFGRQRAKPYFYPVYTTNGVAVTRGYPMDPKAGESNDHIHHKSLWVAHGDVNGADIWSEERGHGRQIHAGLQVSGDTLVETLDWVDKDGRKLLSEKRTVGFGGTGVCRYFDFTIEFQASDGDVKFGDTKEGGLVSVRVTTTMDAAKNGRIENSEGHVFSAQGGTTGPCTTSSAGEPTWGKRARWVTYTGPAEGKPCGVTILDHSKNLRHPTYWHVRGYGLFAANPFGISYFTDDPKQNGSHVLKKDDRLTFRYRVLVHDGVLTKDTIDKAWQEFAR
jgi:hypothetical protein